MSEEDAVAFLEERSFFFKLKAFAKNFEKYGCKPGEKGRYVNLNFDHLVELSKLDKVLRSLFLDLALDIEHYLKVRINAAAMHAGADPFEVVDTFLEDSAASVVSKQTKALNRGVGAGAVRLAASTLGGCDPESRPAIVSVANDATETLSEVTKGRDPRHVEHAIAWMAGPRTPERAPWFDKTYAVKSFLDYADTLFDTFSKAFASQGLPMRMGRSRSERSE